MIFCYVLINTKNSYEHKVTDKLSRFDEVVDVDDKIHTIYDVEKSMVVSRPKLQP